MTAVALAMRSMAEPLLTMMPHRAARLIPEMMATGVARSSGQGVATTSTATTASGRRVIAYASAHRASVTGVNKMA
jgi:hypothetical protein